MQMNVPAKLWHGGWKPLLTCVPLTYWYSLLALGDKFEKRHKQFTQVVASGLIACCS